MRLEQEQEQPTTVVSSYKTVMVCRSADIVDNDHGSASLVVDLEGPPSTHQAFIISPSRAMEILRLFQVERLADCVGKPVVTIRTESVGYIRVLRRLQCYQSYEVDNRIQGIEH